MRSLQSFRDEQRTHLGIREPLEDAADRRERRKRVDDVLADVVASDPKIGLERRVERDDDSPSSRHASHLAESRVDVVPVVECDDRHGGIERVVRERQTLGGSEHRGCSPRGALSDHDGGRLDSYYLTVAGLVRARAGAHIDDGSCVAERVPDGPCKPGVLNPNRCVPMADLVIERHMTIVERR
jgi:hypothetical protein